MRTTLSIVVIVVIGILMFWERQYVGNLSFAEQEIKDLDSIQERQIDLFVEQSDLLTTLASGLLAALGALLLKSDGRPVTGGRLAYLVIAAVLSGASLYFGYLAYQEVIWMLQNRFLNFENPYIEWARRLQFFAFLTSVCFSFLFLTAWVSTGSSSARKT